MRDAPLEYSHVPFDMKPEIRFADEIEVPVNPIKVKLKPYPWSKSWHRHTLRGVEPIEGVPKVRWDIFLKNKYKNEQFDLMKDYRESVPEEDQVKIWKEVKSSLKNLQERENEARRQKLLSKDETK